MYYRKRESHDVEIVTFDFGDVNSSITLNRICPRLIRNIFTAKIITDLLVAQRMEPHPREIQPVKRLLPDLIDNSDSCVDPVIPPGQFSQHASRFIFVLGL